MSTQVIVRERAIRKAVSAGGIYTFSRMTHSTSPLIELTASLLSSTENHSSCSEKKTQMETLQWILGMAILVFLCTVHIWVIGTFGLFLNI